MNLGLNPFWFACAATSSSSVQFQTDGNNTPTAAVLNGVGAQATFQNTAGQVVVVTSNSPGTVTIPISGGGQPSIPEGSDVTVVSNDPSIPSTSTSSTPGGQEFPDLCMHTTFQKNMLCCWLDHIESRLACRMLFELVFGRLVVTL